MAKSIKRFLAGGRKKNGRRHNFRFKVHLKENFAGKNLVDLAWKDLAEIEEKDDRNFLIDIGTQAATNAINENKALNIPITFMEDGWVVRRMPKGNIEKIVEVNSKGGKSRERKLMKGTVLHVKKPR